MDGFGNHFQFRETRDDVDVRDTDTGNKKCEIRRWHYIALEEISEFRMEIINSIALEA